MPEVGPLLDPATLAPGDAAEPAGAPPACSPRKRTKGPKGGGAALLTPRRLCELLELESPRSAAAAEHYWRVSAAARARGPAGMAACALLAAKNYEIDLHSPDEACGAHPLLAEYDDAEYEADEARRRPPPHLAPLMLPHTSLRVRRRLRCLRTRARMALSWQLAILKDLDYCLVAP